MMIRLLVMTPFDTFGAPVFYDDSAATDRLAVAAATISSSGDDKAANLAAMAAMVDKIKTDHPAIQVIVFGELVLGLLYDQSDPAGYQRNIAETIPGPATSFVAGLSGTQNVVIVFGMAEVEGSDYYNSQAIVFPDGTVMKYRKRGLNSGDRAAGFKRGSTGVDATIFGIRTTFMICSDYQDQEVLRDVAHSIAGVVLISTGNATRLSMENDYVARQVNKWVIHGNRFDTALGIDGLSYIADPTGAFRSEEKGDFVYAFRNIGVYQ
jgi:predicted amidohydrolase